MLRSDHTINGVTLELTFTKILSDLSSAFHACLIWHSRDAGGMSSKMSSRAGLWKSWASSRGITGLYGWGASRFTDLTPPAKQPHITTSHNHTASKSVRKKNNILDSFTPIKETTEFSYSELFIWKKSEKVSERTKAQFHGNVKIFERSWRAASARATRIQFVCQGKVTSPTLSVLILEKAHLAMRNSCQNFRRRQSGGEAPDIIMGAKNY